MSLPTGPDRIDANLLQSTGAYIATSKTGEVVEARDLYVVNTGLPLARFNVAFPKRPGYRVESALDKAAGYFAAKGLGYRVQVRADLAGPCRAALSPLGFAEDAVPGMRLDPIADVPPPPEGLEIRRVTGADALAQFRDTAFEGFGLPVQAAPIFLTGDFLALPEVALFVGYAEGVPCSTASLVATGSVAGVYWVSTLAGFRSRGFGEALTWAAVREGRERGCTLASLQASKVGFPVYQRMGFVQDRDYATFDAPEA